MTKLLLIGATIWAGLLGLVGVHQEPKLGLAGTIYQSSDYKLLKGLIDSYDSKGSAGQVLSSTGTSTQWVAQSGGGGSFTTTTINGLTTTAYTFVGAGGLTIATSGPGTITLTQGAGGGGSGSVGTSTIGFPAVYDTANSVTGTSKLTSSQITEADPIFAGYPALATSSFLGISYPSLASSTFLTLSYPALATSSFLGVSYPALATSTFLSLSGGTMTGGLTMTDASSTNLNVGSLFSFLNANGTSVTTTNLSVGSSLKLPSNSVTDAMISSASAWNAWLSYPALATSSFLGIGYPALATSSFLGVSYPALATSTFLAKAATPTVTSTYQITSGGVNIIQPIPTTSLRFSGSNATTTMYSCGFVNNNFTSSKLQTVIHATAASGIQFILSYGANCDGSTASTTIGTFIAQNQVGGTIQNVAVTIPANNYLVIQGVSASSTNIDSFDFALLGHNYSN